MSPQAKLRLKALAQLERKAAYLVLEDSFWHRWDDLPEATRSAAELIASTIEHATVEGSDED